MVDINSTLADLQSTLQAQLQANRTQANTTVQTDRGANERFKPKNDSQSDPQPFTKAPNRLNDLSSSEDLEAASDQITQFTGTNREAPTGRTSARQSSLQNQPLGQIIDIRV